MTPDAFCRLFPEEYAAAEKAFGELEEARMQRQWEMTRTLAAIAIQPHVRKRITPRELLPLPWDKESAEADWSNPSNRSNQKILTKAERRKRIEELERRFKGK